MYHNKNSDNKNKAGKNVFIWTLVLVFMAAIAVGDVIENPAEAITAELEAGGSEDFSGQGGPASEETEEVSREGMIKLLNFEKDATIRDGLRTLAALYKVNIVPSSKVDGQLNVTTLYDVTFKQAMEAILGYQFKYERDGNFIRVYTAEEYKKMKEDKSRMVHKVFTLYYISAAEAAKLVSSVLSSAGKVTSSSPAETGISIGKQGISGGKAGGDSMALHDAIVVYDYPENIAKVEKVIKSLDVRPKQVLIEATILSATLTEGMQLGIDWNLLNGVALDGTAETITTQESVVGGSVLTDAATTPISQLASGVAGTALEIAGFTATGASGLRIGISAGDVVGFITALESVTDITVLANPKILALNKQMGTVFIGTKLGYRDRTTISDTGQATIGEVQFLDTGTKLSFRPYIGNDGYIRMDIYPKDSSGEIDSEGIPQETTAELTTNIMVKDGQTIVIGGLFRDAVTTTRSQVPLLGDLPFIGAAFRSTTDREVRQEVIVLLTTHIIEEPSELEGAARAEDVSRKRSGAKERLQWISRSRLAEDHYANAVQYHLGGYNLCALHAVNSALEIRPTYLEAIRLKEKIIGETDPNGVATIERNMLNLIEQEQASMWRRR
jgi:type II secretory pathway component GspD/PulD (secretin)